MSGKEEVTVAVQDATTDEVDFAKLPINEALQILQTTPHGLTSEEHAKRLIEYGPNKLPESTRNPILVFLGYMWNPLAWAMEVAAIISICLLDYADFALIVSLLIANSVISYHEEANADNAIKALAAALAPKARVLRDGTLRSIDAIDLVPGDVILIAIGNVVPADIKILAEDEDDDDAEVPMQVDQAALTGESLPSKKFSGDVCYSGSAIKQGERHCVVYATGINTFFGRAAALIGQTNNVANLVVVMNRIGGTCLGTIGVWIIIELAIQFGHYNHSCGPGEEACPTLTNMLVIIVGGIPIAMPTVLSVTLALGAANLAKEGAIVARMSAVEELAGLDILCSDKTGTLTLNKLSVEPNSVLCVSGRPLDFVMKHAALSANTITEEPIDIVLSNSYADKNDLTHFKLTKFVPFNPTDKITIAYLTDERNGFKFRVLKGSPQVVLSKAHDKEEKNDLVNNKMIEFANRGFRSLGIAYAEGYGESGVNTPWEMIGLVPMFDPPRHDTAATITNCQKQGIEVKMITGDHLLIGKETCKMLGMGTNMFTSETLIKAKAGDKTALAGFKDITDMCENCNGFAEVFPEHKFEIVEILQNADHVCGMTGDGVNDAPALKKADVGIAVDGATDAARGAADIVLTEPGLSTIVTAVIGARKIFQRMTTYAKYTVSMTFRICFTFGLLTVIYDWYFPTILIVILAVFNDGAMIALAKDRVIASPVPNSWNLKNIFLMGIVYGLYLTLSSWALYQTAVKTNFFEDKCGLFSLEDRQLAVHGWCSIRLMGPEFAPVRESIYTTFPSMPKDLVTLEGVSACALGGDKLGYFDILSEYGQCVGFGQNNEAGWTPMPGTPTILQQCITEQKYVRGAMMRSLLYNQVSISGQALVFVVRTQKWSLISRAGAATYIAFIAAQVGSTLIAAFGFNGYTAPRFEVQGGIFSMLSTGNPTPFFHNTVPIALTESRYTASVIGCTSYVIVAWIWSAIWHVPLDLVKWILCWVLNDDGFRDAIAYQEDHAHRAHIQPKENELSGAVASSASNPLGRVSLKQPVTDVLDRKSASVVPITRNSAGGVAKVSADPAKALNIARNSLVKKET